MINFLFHLQGLAAQNHITPTDVMVLGSCRVSWSFSLHTIQVSSAIPISSLSGQWSTKMSNFRKRLK